MTSPLSSPKAATPATAAANRAVLSTLDFADRRSFDDARRGFVATIDPPVIRAENGRVVWDLTRYDFLDGDCPETVNPSLWRQAQLTVQHGLFRVTDRIHQIRGFDIANMTIVEGDTGYVVIDPLLIPETAAAGMRLAREHLGDKPIRAIVYTHSHTDHFGGVKGVVSAEEVARGDVRIVAPSGFMEHTVSENVHAGNAMKRRAQYMYGSLLPADDRGVVSVGLGAALADGAPTLLAPTDLVAETGTEMVLDGVRIVFQYTPDSEAPAEMNFFLPDLRALCMAENVSHNMHNLYTLRGAQVRDAAAWSDYIRDALDLFGDRTDVLFISHHWPARGRATIREFMEKQRDLYRFIHDETLRWAARGLNAAEIAERLELPPALANLWSNRGYYGTLEHNVKAVYQKYLGWFDANPANLHPHPPTAAAERYVEFMGGADEVLRKARASFEAGDYRWVAEVVGRVVFADPENEDARALQADAFEQLGYQAEAASWRNFYLTGAQELRSGVAYGGGGGARGDMLTAMTTEMLLDHLAVRLDGAAAAACDAHVALDVDGEERIFVLVRHGVLVHSRRPQRADVDATVALSRPVLARLVLGALTTADAEAADHVHVSGDVAAWRVPFDLRDRFDPAFPIVTPRILGRMKAVVP
ncbi:alkyl/aryl-sulfatase [Rhodococcus rhodochrous]|uniref:Linear primary-alkylsulfatase n=1 Tax=Rhodococcus rhodochrous KG-21 TaxID=1441923 RepID=A0A0M8PSH1_RHORH|nr:alkyl sulfatase dimerization domain-containing protein [Rhodococcus rhodochrous]KOS57658.1 hypothetical protein Z051_02515 [Rhodococcus rhodochrous KG-21]